MTERTKALGTLALITAAAFFAAWLLSPWADTVAIILVIGMAPPATIFAVTYMLTRPWWTTMIGRAMLISSSGLALLVDISLLYMWLGEHYELRDAVRLTVYTLIFTGAWFKLLALWLPEGWRPRRFRRGRSEDSSMDPTP